MPTLLSRVADQLYWGGRYLERAHCTARLVRTFSELMIDLPTGTASSWDPLLAVAGSTVMFEQQHQGVTGEQSIVQFLVAERDNPGSVVSSVERARENLRTTREVMPRDAWQTVNDLFHYVVANADGGAERRGRTRFLNHVIAESQRVDGVMTTVMTRDAAYEVWRLGQSIERADMTTRVLGVRAAALLTSGRDRPVQVHDDVQWMGLLRSVSGLQMYQRVTRAPIDGATAVRFLLFERSFPRSLTSCTQRMREALERLPQPDRTLPAVERLESALALLPARADDGDALDAAMDELQLVLAGIDDAVATAFVRSTAG